MSKIQAFLDKYFHMIFNNSHFLYTIIFVLSSFLIALLSLIPSTEVGTGILFLATTLSITFIFLMFEGLIPQLERYLFSPEKKFDLRKIICFLINYFIAFGIILPYFLTGSSNQITIQFLAWDVALPVIFLVIYFGWSLVQIFFLRIWFEDVSIKVDDKINNKHGTSKTKESIDLILLIVAFITPVLLQLATFFGFLSDFTPGPSDPQEPLIWYAGCNIIILVIIIITSWRLITLFYKSRKIGSSNSYSSMFYILIWLILWFRTFSFLNALRGAVQASTEGEIIARLIDILLMIITAFLVLKSLGDKIYDSVIFKANNLPFFLFAFTILYIEGQIIMVTGAGSLTGVFADRNQINLITNFLVILITVSFYWWYAEHSLERKGFIIKKRFYPEDVILIVNDFKDYLETKGAIDSNIIGGLEVKSFLDAKNIKIQEVEPPKEEPIESEFLNKIEDEKTPNIEDPTNTNNST
ncbi:MAG: hypothetical protein ACXAAH_09035 [Promethearchaeota archaeon]|jgi:hypothetical protein